MKTAITLLALAALAGCGVETAGTAATGASIKKQEVEQGMKALDQAQQKIGKAMEQAQQARENAER